MLLDSYFKSRLNLADILNLWDFSGPKQVCSEVVDPFIANQFY